MSQTNDFDIFDPAGVFKNMRNESMDAWSKMMIQFVNTEAYADATAAILNAWLTSSVPLRKKLESTVTQALRNLNIPARSDITSLAERLTNIEMRLDDMDAKLDEFIRSKRKGSSNQKSKSGSKEEDK